MVMAVLRARGIVAHAERIETGWRVLRAGKRIVGARPVGKVLADIVGVRQDGRAVLVEVKARAGATLPWSTLQDHQHANLARWASAGALCMVAWVNGADVRLWEYPVDGWEAGGSLRWERSP
jgi:RecB family endonuclease NucS